MTVQMTTRLNLVRWTGDTDEFDRSQVDASHAALESGVLKWGRRTTGDSARPSPSTTWSGALYYDEEFDRLSYTDAVEWIDLVLLGKTMTGANLILDNGVNIALGTGSGTKIGTATSQKLGFFNATPVVQPANTVTNRAALQALGLVASAGDARWEVRTIPTGTARPGSGTLGEVIFEERTASILVWAGSWVSVGAPCGTIKAIYSTILPTGWLWCDGSAIGGTLTELIALVGANTPDFRDKSLMGRTTTGAAFSTTGQANLPATILFAFTPDTVTSAPGGGDVQAKALTNAGSIDNAPASAKINWIIKT